MNKNTDNQESLLEALSRVVMIMHSMESERLAHHKCFYEAVLSLPLEMRNIPWEKYNSLMHSWRTSNQPWPKPINSALWTEKP